MFDIDVLTVLNPVWRTSLDAVCPH